MATVQKLNNQRGQTWRSQGTGVGGVEVEGPTHTLMSSVLAVCNFSLKWGSVSSTSITSLR